MVRLSCYTVMAGHCGASSLFTLSRCRKVSIVVFPLVRLSSRWRLPQQSLICSSGSSYKTRPRCSNGHLVVEDDGDGDGDDIRDLLKILPLDLQDRLSSDRKLGQLVEVILDLGRPPQACYVGNSLRQRQYLRDSEISVRELEYTQQAVGEFGADNRAGIDGTLHRICAIRSRTGEVIGLTLRIGRAISGQIDMIRDLLDFGESILFIGRPGVGKTTVMREISRVLSDELHKRVVIVDTSNEIGGSGDIPHPAIGSARRFQVPKPSMQYQVMIEAVENHMPEVIIIDEIGTEEEVYACRTIAERGVMLIGTAHGQHMENVVKNPMLCDLIGGLKNSTLSDEVARARNVRKSVLERKAPPTFPFLIEIRERYYWIVHRTERSVDALLEGSKPLVELRRRDEKFNVIIERWKTLDGGC